MSAIIDSYNQLVLQMKDINDKIRRAESEITRLSSDISSDATVRIAKLEEQLEKIDDYLLRIKGFEELAKKSIDSLNVLTIETPPGYRVNLNRLRNWAMMIDPDPRVTNDPYAQRVYVTAKCDEHFLEQKQTEFTARIAELKQDLENGTTEEIEILKQRADNLRASLYQYAHSEAMFAFAKEVVEENERCWYRTAPETFTNPAVMADTVRPGAYAAALSFAKEEKAWLRSLMGEFYDEEAGRVLLPVEIRSDHEYVMTITCSPARRKKLDAALQNLVLTTIHENPAGLRKVYVLDGVRYSTASMGSLRKLEESFAMARIPRNPEQLTATLEEIVAGFADMDEMLELYDSVAEYNAAVEDNKKLPLTTLILFGWPQSFTGRNQELLTRIMTNYERYGISFITVEYANSEKRQDNGSSRDTMPEYARQNAIHVSMLANETTISFADGEPHKFVWYTLGSEISDEYVSALLSNKISKETIGNEYTDRYSLTTLPAYTREYKKIELPFGIDGKDEAHSISFEYENFATYLVGASRSGKSTLLHTLIAGLIRNYHPDNLELWLADFKQLEFKKYIRHLPPHVKYVLLDESQELVFDLIDRLTAEMMERQKIFAREGVDKLDKLDVTKLDKPLPVIFVILDEFSIMSQSIAQEDIYKRRLQNLLAKGAALGIKFLFSSQTFTTGVVGLTPTARAQIQQRIAMKGSKEEISETLELSSNMKTEQVQNWMDALPPHYALVKFRSGPDTLPEVKRFLVMYFKDYGPRDTMIDSIRESMRASAKYTPGRIDTYVDKEPVLVDGNSLDAFDEKAFKTYVRQYKRQNEQDLSGDEMVVSLGTPRLMVKMKPAVLSSETRENLLLISRAAEQACAASVLLSAIRSYRLQRGEVEIWAYGKNPLYKKYKDVFAEYQVEIREGLDEICDAIREMKQTIRSKRSGNKLIVMIGMDRICTDFEYVDGSSSSEDNTAERDAAAADAWNKLVHMDMNVKAVVEETETMSAVDEAWSEERFMMAAMYRAEGKTPDEITQLLAADEAAFRAQYILEHGEEAAAAPEVQEEEIVPVQEEPVKAEAAREAAGAYDAMNDLLFVIKQGSRLGYHFFMNLNSIEDLKGCKMKPEFFRYRMSFQLSDDDSRTLFGRKIASSLPEHICQFDDSLEKYSFRPYLHQGIGWEGWYVDEKGQVISPYKEAE